MRWNAIYAKMQFNILLLTPFCFLLFSDLVDLFPFKINKNHHNKNKMHEAPYEFP